MQHRLARYYGPYSFTISTGSYLATAGERTRERLLARVHAHVVHQLVLGLEGLALAHTLAPVARVHTLLTAAHVVRAQVRHQLVHAREGARARAPRLRLDPVAHDVGARRRRPHVAEKGARFARARHVAVALGVRCRQARRDLVEAVRAVGGQVGGHGGHH